MPEGWSLRPAVAADREFLFQLHKASMGSYIEEMYGPWDDETQWGFFDRWFSTENAQVIRSGDQDVGVIGLEHLVDEVYVTRIEIQPDAQNRGIGTAVLRRLVQEAGEAGKRVSLHVFEINPARRLYRRLGFTTVGEHEGRLLMTAEPPRSGHRSQGG